MNTAIKDIDSYIAGFPAEVREKLASMRETIRKAAPAATEDIKYGMPTFVMNGNLVHFAAFKNHIGFYPTPDAIKQFADKLSAYKTSKGAIQFPMQEKLPLKLVSEITKYRVAVNKAKSAKK